MENQSDKREIKSSNSRRDLSSNSWEIASNLSSSKESKEKLGMLTPNYINGLLEDDNLARESIYQLNAIKNVIKKYGVTMKSNRLAIKDDLVCLKCGDADLILPIEIQVQSYDLMKNDTKNTTYPDFAKWLLLWMAEATKKTFTFPDNRDELQEGIVDWVLFTEALDTPDNRAIIYERFLVMEWSLKRHSVQFWGRFIPIGRDDEWFILTLPLDNPFYSYIEWGRGFVTDLQDLCWRFHNFWDRNEPLGWLVPVK